MKQPLAVILTDTHLHLSNVKENIDINKQAIALAKSLGIKDIYHLGDIFESRKAQPLNSLKTFGKILKLYAEEEMELFAIPGNHDKVDYESEDSYLDEFEFHPNFHLLSDYQILHHYPSKGVGCHFHFIPYFDEKTTYSKYLKEIEHWVKDKKVKHILLTHVGVIGTTDNDGEVIHSGLDVKDLKVFDSVLIGHYHNKGKMGTNIYYVGSAFQHNFSEDNQKGFTVLYSDGSHEFVQSKFKEYVKLKIDLDRTSQKELDTLLKRYAKSENYIRFEFTGETAKLKALNTTKFKSTGIDVKLKRNNIVEGIVLASKNEFISFNKEGIKTEFGEFCTLNKITNKEQGEEYLNNILLQHENT